MKPLRHLALLLFLAWICVDAAVARTPRHGQPAEAETLAVCSLGLVLGQTALLCGWLVWSRRPFLWRICGTLAALYGMARWASLSAGEPLLGDRWFTVLLLYAALITLPLSAIYLAGWRIPVPLRAPGGSRCGSRQFTIASLLSLTTAVAILLGARQFAGVPGKPLWGVLGFCLAAAVCSLVAMGLTGRGREPLAATFLLGLTCPVVALLLARTGVPPVGVVPLIALTVVQVGSIVGSLTVLRVAGYHLRRVSFSQRGQAC